MIADDITKLQDEMSRVQKVVEDLAADVLRLRAQRDASSGHYDLWLKNAMQGAEIERLESDIEVKDRVISSQNELIEVLKQKVQDLISAPDEQESTDDQQLSDCSDCVLQVILNSGAVQRVPLNFLKPGLSK